MKISSAIAFTVVALRSPRFVQAQDAVAGRLALQPAVVRDADGHEHAAEIGYLGVRENRQRSDSRVIEVAFVRVRSAAKNPGTPIVFLNGGPGQPATPFAFEPDALQPWVPYLELGDVIFFDQRGTGRSRPGLAWAANGSLPLDFFANREHAVQWARDMQARCREHFVAAGVDLAAYDTEASADDVDDLRAALGVERIRLVGYSHGTTLSLAAIHRHRPHLERAVLVGTDGPNHWGSAPSVLQTQLRKLSALAAADPAVNHAVPDMVALLDQVLADLEQEPLDVPITDRRTGAHVVVPLGRWGLEFLLRIDVGDGNDFPLFPALIFTLAQHRTDVIQPILERRFHQLGQGVSAMSIAMLLTAWPPQWLRERFAAERESCSFAHVANYFDLEIGDVWNLAPLDDSYREPIVADLPVLFVSGSLDSNAPPFQAEEIRWGLPNSTHLIVANAGHEDMLPNAEVRAVMRRFLGGDDVCDARVSLPTPRFVGIRKQP